MEHPTFVAHRGQRILRMDYRWMGDAPDFDAAKAFYAEARKLIDAQPEGSLCILTIVSASQRYTRKGVALMREFTQANAPYVRKAAVVGASTIHRVLLGTFALATGTDIKAFDLVEEALDWLAE